MSGIKGKSGIYQRKPFTDEHKRKMSEARMGMKLSEKTKKKIKEARKRQIIPTGENSKLWGRHHSEATKKKISESHKGLNNWSSGKNSNLWRGGVWHNPYSVDWTNDLKRAIRKRDRYTCQICNKEPSIYCHHIDYNKLNCNPENLIILCHSCHTKTNYNREFWINYFEKRNDRRTIFRIKKTS